MILKIFYVTKLIKNNIFFHWAVDVLRIKQCTVLACVYEEITLEDRQKLDKHITLGKALCHKYTGY